jgi:CheY-like chemotaxis protein
LLVEDDEVDIMSVRRAFLHNKITNPLFIAHNGEEGLAFLRKEGEFAGSDHRNPNLILLDLNMPRMDGHEFLSIIKNDPAFKEIPVVILTSSNLPGDIKKSYQNGVAGYLVKPVTFNNFADLIRTLDLYWTLSEMP